ncbi:TPA: hypothetical protein ACLEB8_004830 [Pseudomonas aeruginosa]
MSEKTILSKVAVLVISACMVSKVLLAVTKEKAGTGVDLALGDEKARAAFGSMDAAAQETRGALGDTFTVNSLVAGNEADVEEQKRFLDRAIRVLEYSLATVDPRSREGAALAFAERAVLAHGELAEVAKQALGFIDPEALDKLKQEHGPLMQDLLQELLSD